jgi:hypothetical protein
MEAMLDVLARFWAKVDRSGDCWEWTAGGLPEGYGRFRAFGQNVVAHRFAWILMNGPIPDGVMVLHECDNPKCVRPAHLFLGDHVANKTDAVAKARHSWPRGERHPRAKLTEADVRAIRARRGEPLASIAADFPVGVSTIGRVLQGRYWREVGGV